MRMRLSFWSVALGFVLALGVAGCRRHGADESGPGRLLAVVSMSDARGASQLVSGFHSVEEGAWRWTERHFTIDLARPARAEQRGATLAVSLTVPPVSIEKLKSLTLSAKVNGTALDPETYSAPGNYTYRRELPASALSSDPVRVDFSLDKAIPPGNPDIRELGVVVLSIGLAAR